MLLMMSVKSQVSDNTYPIYKYDSANNKIAVIISIRQAQMIDNDYDILNLLEKAKTGCDSLAYSYQIVITDLGRVIATQEVNIKELNKLNNKNNEIIENLKSQISKYIEDGMKSNALIENKNTEIQSLNKTITGLKVEKVVGYTGIGVLGGGLVAVLVTGIVKGWFR